ncbi:hypothetical protein N8794_00430 [Candidatus Pelagibacter sp.]|nr:hypothetical protein [Candidatus Pelagibacter sp.]
MKRVLVFFVSSILVYNSFTTSVLAVSTIKKTKIHQITSCEKYLNSKFEKYIDCLNEEVFTSKQFAKLSKNKKNDIQSLLAISNILQENVEDGFISDQKVLLIWDQILNSPYKAKIKKKELQKVLEQTTCMDKEDYEPFIKCFSSQFRNFEIYQKSDLLSKRRMETIVSNSLYLTRPGSKVYAETKNYLEKGQMYSSSDGFNFFVTYMDKLGSDYFLKVKDEVDWEKVIKFIIIAIIMAIVAKKLMKSFSKNSYSSSSSSTSTAGSSSTSGLTANQTNSLANVGAQPKFMQNMFRYAPSNSVLHKKWFKYSFVKGF